MLLDATLLLMRVEQTRNHNYPNGQTKSGDRQTRNGHKTSEQTRNETREWTNEKRRLTTNDIMTNNDT